MFLVGGCVVEVVFIEVVEDCEVVVVCGIDVDLREVVVFKVVVVEFICVVEVFDVLFFEENY